MKPSHITTPRCLSDASFTVGYSPMYTVGDDLDYHRAPPRRYAVWVVLVVIALCLLPFVVPKL